VAHHLQHQTVHAIQLPRRIWRCVMLVAHPDMPCVDVQHCTSTGPFPARQLAQNCVVIVGMASSVSINHTKHHRPSDGSLSKAGASKGGVGSIAGVRMSMGGC
jgi:hypothetical protein